LLEDDTAEAKGETVRSIATDTKTGRIFFMRDRFMGEPPFDPSGNINHLPV
jgi:hypothetical protein